MDDTTCYGRSAQCPRDGHVAPRARVKRHDWQRQGPRFRCERCGMVVAATTGTASGGRRTDLHTSLRGATALAEGVSLRATGRLVRGDQETVNPWLPVLGQHGQGVMHAFCRTLPLHECHLEELWTCIHTQEGHLTPPEHLAAVSGEAWVWMACSPVDQVGPAWVVGKRPLRSARRRLLRRTSATEGSMPCFPSDARPHDAHALLAVYGVWDTPPRHGRRGRIPHPRRDPPPEVCDAVVVTERAHGRVVHVTTRLVSGTTEHGATALRMSPVRRTITTDGVERQHVTVRQHARRMGRTVHAFSTDPASLEAQRTVACAYAHCVIPHRRLRQRFACPLPPKGGKGSSKTWKSVPPAMAAGLTDHVWTMDALLSFRVPPKSLWL